MVFSHFGFFQLDLFWEKIIIGTSGILRRLGLRLSSELFKDGLECQCLAMINKIFNYGSPVPTHILIDTLGSVLYSRKDILVSWSKILVSFKKVRMPIHMGDDQKLCNQRV